MECACCAIRHSAIRYSLCPAGPLAMPSVVSYAQRYEDLYLLRCFGSRPEGFYIDIGSGHPVYDNMSFAFYLRGWRGITVEPNPWLARLTRDRRPCPLGANAVRQGLGRDHRADDDLA